MRVRSFRSSTTTNTTLVTTAETVAVTLSGLSTSSRGESIRFTGVVCVDTGVGTTGVTIRVREGSLTGTLVGQSQTDTAYAAAGGTETHPIAVTHSAPGEFSGKTYVLTVEQVGATGNGNIDIASLDAVIV